MAVVVAAVFYIVAGVLHFMKSAPYLRIMPPYIPWHAAMVGVSGAFEILGGLGLLVPTGRRAAAWALVALLLAVFPANLRRELKAVNVAILDFEHILGHGQKPGARAPSPFPVRARSTKRSRLP
jgi:uncharacterized membrane protein